MVNKALILYFVFQFFFIILAELSTGEFSSCIPKGEYRFLLFEYFQISICFVAYTYLRALTID